MQKYWKVMAEMKASALVKLWKAAGCEPVEHGKEHDM